MIKARKLLCLWAFFVYFFGLPEKEFKNFSKKY